MTCKCCRIREANKKNTHYLTDAIIRSCLNIDGSSEREKGLFANLSEVSHVEIGFQRSTPPEALEVEMNRPPTDDEIERARRNPYAVDHVFCDHCEKLFTEIEHEFLSKVLPKLRAGDPSFQSLFISSNAKAIRLFFYLQLWRSAVCLSEFSISSDVMENLRKYIINHKTVTKEELFIYPLSITYLDTTGGPLESTKNYIAHLRFRNPFIIIMNDFIIEFFESESSVKLLPFYNINDSTFLISLNLRESEFQIRTLPDKSRRIFLKAYTADIVKERLQFYKKSFVEFWFRQTATLPSMELVDEYLGALTKNENESILNYAQSEVDNLTRDFVAAKLKKS